MAGALTLPVDNFAFCDLTWGMTGRVTDYFGQFLSRHSKLEIDTSPSQGDEITKTAIGFDEETSSIYLNLCGVIDWVNIALENLDEVYAECSEDDWDGYGAVPVSYQAYFETAKLIRIMPFLPMPDILPEPEGDIGLEWNNEKGFSFTVSLSGENVIAYAGLFGENNETYGSEAFSDSVPKTILDNLKRLFPTTL